MAKASLSSSSDHSFSPVLLLPHVSSSEEKAWGLWRVTVMKPGLGLAQLGERLMGTSRGWAVPCRAVGVREREGSKGHPSVPCTAQPPWGTARSLFIGMLTFV